MNVQLSAVLDGRPVGFATGARGVDSSRPTLVLIHGAGGSQRTWLHQLQALDATLNIIALELPGHGSTPGPSCRTISDYTDWVARVLDMWRLPGRPVLGGHSMGGAVAIEMVLTHPELLRGLILIGTGARLSVNQTIFTGLEQNFETTVAMIMKWSFAKTSDPALLAEAVRLMTSHGPGVVRDDFHACNDFDRRPDVSRIDLPTLVVCGDQDKMTPPFLSEFLGEEIPASQVAIIDRAGHQVMQEQSELVNRAMAEFIRNLP